MFEFLTTMLNSYGLLIAAGLMLMCALAASALAYEELSRRSHVDRRLAAPATGAKQLLASISGDGAALQWLERIGRRISQSDEKEVVGLRLRLHRAGFTQRDAVFWFYGARALLILILPMLGLVLASVSGAGLTPFGNLLIAGA